MPFTVSVKNDFDKFAAGYLEGQQKQVRYAARIALNNVAKAAVIEIKAQVPKIFDSPVPATVNAEFIRYATADNLTASIGIKDFIGKGPSPQDWLAAEILGEGRRHKRSENALIAKGMMEPDQFWVPGRDDETRALLDGSGNLPSSIITETMSRIGAFGEHGYRANASDRTKKRLLKMKMVASKQTGTDYFVARDSDGRPYAVEKLFSKGVVKPILWFVDRKPVYKSRFHFNDLVLGYVEGHIGAEMAKCLELAFATAR